jgi:hypothetical protein
VRVDSGIALAVIDCVTVRCVGDGSTGSRDAKEVSRMTLLMVILLLVLVGAIPAWPYSRSWGYTPSGLLLVLLVVLLVLSATGRL